MNYVENTKEALCDVAVVTNQLMQFFDFSTDGSVLGISRLSAYLHLLHHQVSICSCYCVVRILTSFSVLSLLPAHFSSPFSKLGCTSASWDNADMQVPKLC